MRTKRRILVVGSGGREHAICRALRTDPEVELLVAPGNPGTAALGRNCAVAATDVAGLLALAKSEGVALVVPGPEAALVCGLADALAAAAVPCCGPCQRAARLESSKRYMRELTQSAGVPGARYVVVTRSAELSDAVASFAAPPVVKADGLAAGKGVLLPDDAAACVAAARELLAGSLGEAGRVVVLEERLVGVEASLFYLCDGVTALALPHARDHKRIFDGDAGPNTGGMGAVSPNPAIDAEVEARVRSTIVEPTLATLAEAGAPFRGFLFAGVMLTGAGPRLLEFNVRLGDPEAQAILPRLAPGSFADLCLGAATGALAGGQVTTAPGATCAVVLAAAGYPGPPRTGDEIRVALGLERSERWLDHAGTRRDGDRLVTAGGRVAAVVARGSDAVAARQSAYAGIAEVSFDGMQYRRDIGA
jgi:phosphoribosylamine--glycine ligase